MYYAYYHRMHGAYFFYESYSFIIWQSNQIVRNDILLPQVPGAGICCVSSFIMVTMMSTIIPIALLLDLYL